MDDASGPAPAASVKTPSNKLDRTSLIIMTLTAGLGATLFMSGLAHAEPMISGANALSGESMLHTLDLDDNRVLFGMLTFGFSLMAAGVWRRSFRASQKARQ